MSNILLNNTETPNEEPNKEEVALRVYDYLDIEKKLADYLDSEAEESDIEPLLQEFAVWLARLGKDDLKVFRAGFDRLTQSMNEVAKKKIENPQLKWRLKLKKQPSAGHEMSYVRELDDDYWEKQFPEQYVNGGMISRNAGESDKNYTARYTYACMHGLLFAPFTYLRG